MMRKKKRQSEREVQKQQIGDQAEAGQIDLNCHPNRQDMQVDVPGRLTIANRLKTTRYPINYTNT